MLTRMTQDDWAIVLEVFDMAQSRRGEPGRDDRKLVAARLPGIEKSRLHQLEGGDAAGPLKTIAELRSKASARLGCTAEVACCFKAGRDGFWLYRLLTAHGIYVKRARRRVESATCGFMAASFDVKPAASRPR